MLLPQRHSSSVRHAVLKRDPSSPPDPSGNSTNTTVIVAIVIVVLLSVTLILYVLVKNRKSRRDSPKHVPGDNLFRKLRQWTGKTPRGEYSAQLQPNPSAPSLIGRDGRRSRNTSRDPSPDRESTNRREADPERAGLAVDSGGTNETSGAGVDRNTSVRSIMTLPAYSPSVRPSEQILGREGERGGIDVVLEFPETVDEEEQRRDEEMESLYQIRRTRRQEQAEREERRRQRREARARGDFDTLQRLQEESRRRAESATSGEAINSAALIAEHQAAQANRERRVSSVQYAELGVARHDGSRIRANSTESDNRPLLDSAGSISGFSLERPLTSHERGRSASSVLSVSTAHSDNGSRPAVDENGFEFISLDPASSSRSRAQSRASTTSRTSLAQERDVAELGIQIPAEHPPQYDDLTAGWGDAPPYESPIRTHASATARINGPPRLPSLASVPSIEVTSVISPVSRSRSRSPPAPVAAAPARE